jgi:hypothetical protein
MVIVPPRPNLVSILGADLRVVEPDDVIKIDGDKMGTVAPDGTIWVGDNKRAYAGIVIVHKNQVPIAERHGWEVVGTENDLVWVRRA